MFFQWQAPQQSKKVQLSVGFVMQHCFVVYLNQRNDLIFNLVKWQDVKLKRVMWDSLVDYGKMEWKHTWPRFKNIRRKKVSSLSSLTKLGGRTKLFVLGMERRLGGATNHHLLQYLVVIVGIFGPQGWMSSWVGCVCISLFYNGFFHLCHKKNKKGFENY